MVARDSNGAKTALPSYDGLRNISVRVPFENENGSETALRTFAECDCSRYRERLTLVHFSRLLQPAGRFTHASCGQRNLVPGQTRAVTYYGYLPRSPCVICPFVRGSHFVRQNFIPASLSLLLVSFLLLSATAFATSEQKNPNSNPCNLSEEEVQGLGHDASTEANALDAYIATISWMVHRQRFDELDCIADRARATKERFPGGHWKIHELYKGLYDPVPGKHATEDDWQDLMQLLQRWVQTHPKSATARVGLASALIGYAGEARGHGYADSVSEKGWKLYEERTAEAEKVLDDAEALPVRCPEFYIVKLNIAGSQSWGKQRILALFREALGFEPGYYYYGRAVAMWLEPKWFGEPGDTAKFMQEVADHIGGQEGDAYYFLVASSKDVICGCQDQPKLSLERIERGYDAVERLYGVSMVNLNQLAYLTLHSHRADIILADQTFQRIGTQWSEYSWHDERSFEQSKNWARQMVPVVKQNLAREDEAQANSKTPDGARYQVSIEKTYKEMLRDCVRSDGAAVSQWEGEFETLIRVGANGSVEDSRVDSVGPVVGCLYRKMRSSYQAKSPLFPVPPSGAYWVKIDLDWGQFAPAAAVR